MSVEAVSHQSLIRQDWDWILLDEVATRGSGHTPSKAHSQYWDGGIPWLSLKDTPRLDAGEVTATASTISEEGLRNSSAVMHSEGTVVLLRDAGIGKSGVLGFDGAVSQHFMAWNCGPQLSNWFLYYLFQAWKPEFERIANGSTIQTIGLDYFRQLKVPLPPLAQQQAIVEALVDADDAVHALGRLILKKRAVKRGTMQTLLTGRTRLAGFSGPWQASALGNLLSYEQPGPYLVSSTNYTNTGTPVLTAGKTFLLGHTAEQHGVFRNVPVIIFDDFTTASRYVDFPFKAKSSAMKMLSARSGVDLRFIAERMHLIDFTAVDHKRRWIAEYSHIEVEIPELREQTAIATVLRESDLEIELLEQRLKKARDLRAGVMQQLLGWSTRLTMEAAS